MLSCPVPGLLQSVNLYSGERSILFFFGYVTKTVQKKQKIEKMNNVNDVIYISDDESNDEFIRISGEFKKKKGMQSRFFSVLLLNSNA